MKAPMAGSVFPMDMILTHVYNSQTDLGWGQFLGGQVSISWGKAVKPYHLKNTSFNVENMSSKLGTILLIYTSTIWKYRNGVVHEHATDEIRARQIEKLRIEISQTYWKYEKDHFVISWSLSYQFRSKD